MLLEPEDYTLIGIAMIAAQKLEFALYGIASHLTHLPDVASDLRFRSLTPSDFLSTLPEKRALRRATLGQVTRSFGDKLLLPEDELEAYVSKRNLIAHELWREVVSGNGTGAIPDLRTFLTEFIRDTDQWLAAVKGLLSQMQEAAAIKEGRQAEFSLTPRDIEHREIFLEYAHRTLHQRSA